MAEDAGVTEGGGTTEGGSTTDIFDTTVYVTPNGRALHRTSDEVLEDNALFSVHQITWEGSFADCKAMRDAHYCNELVTENDNFATDLGGTTSDKVIVGMSVRKKVAGRGIFTATVKCFRRVYEGVVDFERVDKNIMTWRALCAEDVPNLEEIRMWQKMLEIGREDLYAEFKYIDNEGATKQLATEGEVNPTIKLAQMIYRGVESFPEYLPVLNITITFAKHPMQLVDNFRCGELLGKVVEATEIGVGGWDIPVGDISGASSPIADFESLAQIYLCNGDKLQVNGDGSYTLQRSFVGLRQVESELYIGAGGVYSPYDTEDEGDE